MTVLDASPATSLVRIALRTQGYFLLPAVLEAALVEQVRSELDRELAAEQEQFGREALADIGQEGYVCNVPGMGPATRALLDHDRIHEILGITLGGQARLSIAQGISLAPGQGRGQWPRRWHADLYQIRQCVPDPGYCFGLNCIAVLDDMAEDNGATCVVPATHAHVAPRSAEGTELEPLAVSVAAPAGSLLMLDGGIWHAAGHNRSEQPRRILKLLFVRSWIRPQVDYSRALAAGIQADLSPRLAATLSLGASAPDRMAAR